MKSPLITAAIALSLAAPAFAGTLPEPTDQSVPVRVSTAGLNLTNQHDVAKLRNRLNKAISEACNPADRFIVTTIPNDRQCREAARAEADAVVQRMAQAAVANQVAQN